MAYCRYDYDVADHMAFNWHAYDMPVAWDRRNNGSQMANSLKACQCRVDSVPASVHRPHQPWDFSSSKSCSFLPDSSAHVSFVETWEKWLLCFPISSCELCATKTRLAATISPSFYFFCVCWRRTAKKKQEKVELFPRLFLSFFLSLSFSELEKKSIESWLGISGKLFSYVYSVEESNR